MNTVTAGIAAGESLGTPHPSLQAQSYRELGRAVEGAGRRDSERESELSVVSPEFTGREPSKVSPDFEMRLRRERQGQLMLGSQSVGSLGGRWVRGDGRGPVLVQGLESSTTISAPHR